MQTKFELIAEARDEQGKGASRRLRRSGRIPAILYGGRTEPSALTLDHNKVQLALAHERFYSSILTIQIGGKPHAALLRDVQRHPWKNQIVHLDLQRVLDDEPVRVAVPLHFKGADTCPGVKTEGGMVSHLRNEIEVTCLPKDLPEYIEVDISDLHLNASLHLSQVPLPAGVTATDLSHGRDPAVVSIHGQRAEEPEAAAAVAAAPAAADAKAAPAAAAKPEAKKDAAKK